MIDSFWTKEWNKIQIYKNFQFLVEIFRKMPQKPLFLLKIKKTLKSLQIDIIFFLAMKIWPLVTFSHKLDHFSAKIAQWDSHWKCEKRHFWNCFSFCSSHPEWFIFYILRKFNVWAWKCNKLDISIIFSSKVMNFWKKSNLS